MTEPRCCPVHNPEPVDARKAAAVMSDDELAEALNWWHYRKGETMTEQPLTPFMQRLVDGTSGGDEAAREQLAEDVRRAIRRIELEAILRREYPSADDAEIKRLSDRRLGEEPS